DVSVAINGSLVATSLIQAALGVTSLVNCCKAFCCGDDTSDRTNVSNTQQSQQDGRINVGYANNTACRPPANNPAYTPANTPTAPQVSNTQQSQQDGRINVGYANNTACSPPAINPADTPPAYSSTASQVKINENLKNCTINCKNVVLNIA
ncbi:unnamed protein product, partial [Owenia fusiformis]